MNKSFKNRLRVKWDEWISYELAATYTKGGKRQRASYVTMCECILQIWNDVPVSAIRNGFLKAGLKIYNNTIQPFAEEISDLKNEGGIEDTNGNATNIKISDFDWSECGWVSFGRFS